MSAPPWTRAPTGTSVGTCHFSSRRRTTNLHGSRQQGAAIRLSPTRGYYGAVDYKGLLVIIEHNPPTHLVATMPQLRDTRVTRLARARASTPSGTRVRGRAYCSTSQLRPGIPTVFTVRTCAQRSSSTTRPATACGHFHISNIYGYASPHGGATVRVSHRPVAPEACNTCSHHLFTSTPRHHRHLLRGRQPTR